MNGGVTRARPALRFTRVGDKWHAGCKRALTGGWRHGGTWQRGKPVKHSGYVRQEPPGASAGGAPRERLGDASRPSSRRGLPRFEREAQSSNHAPDSPGLGAPLVPPVNAVLAREGGLYSPNVFNLITYPLLADGFDQDAARFFVIDEIKELSRRMGRAGGRRRRGWREDNF